MPAASAKRAIGQPGPEACGGGATDVVGADEERYPGDPGSAGPDGGGGATDGGSDSICSRVTPCIAGVRVSVYDTCQLLHKCGIGRRSQSRGPAPHRLCLCAFNAAAAVWETFGGGAVCYSVSMDGKRKASRRSEQTGFERVLENVARKVTTWTGSTSAFALSVSVVVVWVCTGPVFHYSDTWQLVINTGTTIVTFLMVFLIQNSQNRDAAAIQAKLDELLRAVAKARGDFIGIEHMTDAEIEKIREALERETGHGNPAKGGKRASADESVERLLRR